MFFFILFLWHFYIILFPSSSQSTPWCVRHNSAWLIAFQSRPYLLGNESVTPVNQRPPSTRTKVAWIKLVTGNIYCLIDNFFSPAEQELKKEKKVWIQVLKVINKNKKTKASGCTRRCTWDEYQTTLPNSCEQGSSWDEVQFKLNTSYWKLWDILLLSPLANTLFIIVIYK